MGSSVTKPDFYGPFLKVERAKHHIRRLEEIFETFVERNVQSLRPERNNRPGKPPTFPKHTPTVLGDAIHNLRASLDHAYCIIARSNGAQITRNTLFPFGKDRQSLVGSVNGHKSLGWLTDPVVNAIVDGIEPYEGGKWAFTVFICSTSRINTMY